MSAAASLETFDAWAQAESLLSGVTIREIDFARRAWQASRKQALEDASALCRAMDNGDRQTTPTNCAEEIEVMK